MLVTCCSYDFATLNCVPAASETFDVSCPVVDWSGMCQKRNGRSFGGKEFSIGKQNGRIEEKVREGKLTVKLVWKNVRKIRTKEKQMEVEE